MIDYNEDVFKKISFHDKEMSNEMRMYGKQPLSEDEIEFVKNEIKTIQAQEDLFIFNDAEHLDRTCYNFIDDVIYIGRNVFPDTLYGSTHPRDLMSVRAVIAHEYYGHRPYRNEYLNDIQKDIKTTPEWMDECRASITASKISSGLDLIDKIYLIQDAIKRAEEFGQWIQLDDYMKEVLFYGNHESEKNISYPIGRITFISESGEKRDVPVWNGKRDLPKMRNKAKSEYTR